MALAAIGMGSQAGSSILQGFMGASQKKDEAKTYKYNAAVLFRRAKAVIQRTKFQQMRQAKEGARVQGELEAAIGGSGIVSTEGAPMLALALQRSESDLQNYLIGYEGRMEAKELESEALSYLMQAKRAKKAGRMSILGGFLGAGVSALGAFLQFPETTGSGNVRSNIESALGFKLTKSKGTTKSSGGSNFKSQLKEAVKK